MIGRQMPCRRNPSKRARRSADVSTAAVPDVQTERFLRLQNAGDRIQVVIQPSPLRTDSYTLEVEPGVTLLEILLETPLARRAPDGVIELAGAEVVVTVGEHEIYQQFWHVFRPRAGALVCLHALPGNQRQGILIGGAIAIAILSALTYGVASGPLIAAYPTIGAGLAAGAAAAVTVGGAYDLAELFPASCAR